MLTADLAMSWQRGDRINPRYIDAEDEEYLRAAEDLIALFTDYGGRTRAALEESLQEYVGTGTDYRILRGLIKLLTDRCEFETSAPAELLDALYADLPGNQRLTRFDPLTAGELLDLYNVAQAQALLYRSVEMRLWLEPQPPEGFRELFGAIKAYRLIHTVKGNSREGYEVRLDGPASIFQRSQKYGIQMAVFLPALLLCKGWRMRAEIQGRGGQVAYFELTSEQTRLRSHYPEVTAYQNPVTDKLAAVWSRAATDWALEPSSEVIDLGDSAFIPDFVLPHAETGGRVFLEVLGFWTPEHLRERLLEFDHSGVKNFILAAWDELRGTRDPMTNIPPNTIVFKRSLDPAAVGLMADELAGTSGVVS